MPTITVSEQFNCPPETAFAVITDFENLADFIDGVVKVKLLTDGPLAIGTRFRSYRIATPHLDNALCLLARHGISQHLLT